MRDRIKRYKKRIIKFYYYHLVHDKTGYARYLGVKCGEGCQILADPDIAFGSEPWLISLGNNVDVTLGVQFLNHEGGMWCARVLEDKYKDKDLFLPIVIGDNVMIGINSIIMPGVEVGNNVIIGAHSVVTKNIEDGFIVAGIPAKKISTMNQFMENLERRELFTTKKLSEEMKRAYLSKIHPEWVNR